MRALHALITLLSCFFCCLCGDHPDGTSKVSRTQDALGNYHFSYNVANHEGEQFREEGTDALGRVVGSYGLTHVDGTHRVVDYVADKDGFRAAVRSNEPGVVSAEAADASIVKTHDSIPLSVAATSDEHAREIFGRRLELDTSRVSYADEDEDPKPIDEKDESIRESRQNNFDDYRPRSPVAYYPADSQSSLGSSVEKPVEPVRTARVLSEDSKLDSKPLEVYFPPIDPHTAIRRPAYYSPRDRSTEGNFYPTTTSRKPYIPPYGGFDDDPVPQTDRRPGSGHFSPDRSLPGGRLSPDRSLPGGRLSPDRTLPGGRLSPDRTLPGGRLSPDRFVPAGPDRPFPAPAPIPAYGGRRYPPILTPEHRNFDLPHFPQTSSYPRPPGSALPSFPQDSPEGTLFNPPSYDGRIGLPNFVLRAVPIPNGIQAVRVDPTSGRVYERLVYPLFLRHDGHPEYDRNILLHNDDVSDDDAIRHDDPGYLDMPYLRRPYRGVQSEPFDRDDKTHVRNGRNTSYSVDENSLSEPSTADLEWIKKQLNLVEGFSREEFSGGLLPNRISHRDSDFPRINHFDDESRQEYERRIPSSRLRSGSDLLRYSTNDDSSRDSRAPDELTPESSKAVSSKLQEEDTNLKQASSESEVIET